MRRTTRSSPTPSLPGAVPKLVHIHLYSEVIQAELYLVNRRLPVWERPDGSPCYTLNEAQVLRWIGTEVLATGHMG
jgi:hypothetical protein